MSSLPQSDPRNQSVVIFQPFESIKHIDEHGNEFWHGRELMPVLEYTEWRNFKQVIEKAKIACGNSGNDTIRHFVGVNKLIEAAKGAEREIEDVKLSRFACYLIAQNGDPRKTVIANAQTYFAMQARRQEIASAAPRDEFEILQQMMAAFAQTRREVIELREQQAQIALKQELDKEELSRRLDNAEYFTVEAYCVTQGITHPLALRQLWGRVASALSRERGIQIRYVPTPEKRWDTEKMYHQDILADAVLARPRPKGGQLKLPGGEQ